MKNKMLYAIGIMLASTIVSCEKSPFCASGEGVTVTRTLSVPSFDEVSLEVAGDVTITQGPVQSVTVHGESNIIDRLETKVSNGVWNIEFEDGCYENYSLSFDIVVPDISSISIGGTGEIDLGDFTDQGDMSMNIAGSGQIYFHTITGTTNLNMSISGNGSIYGYDDLPALDNMDITISGDGKYYGYPVISNDCDINISGIGFCEVHVLNNLDITISGSGTIYYKGYPTINQTISGTASIVDGN